MSNEDLNLIIQTGGAKKYKSRKSRKSRKSKRRGRKTVKGGSMFTEVGPAAGLLFLNQLLKHKKQTSKTKSKSRKSFRKSLRKRK